MVKANQCFDKVASSSHKPNDVQIPLLRPCTVGERVPDTRTNALLARCHGGDEDAWNEFHAEYHLLIGRTVARYFTPSLRHRIAVPDIMQQVLLAIYVRLSGRLVYVAFEDDLAKWVYGIARHKARGQVNFENARKRNPNFETCEDENGDKTREYRGNRAHSVPFEIPDPMSFAAETPLSDSLWEVLNRQEQLVLQCKLARYTQLEIAGLLGVSDRTVRRVAKRIEAKAASLLG